MQRISEHNAITCASFKNADAKGLVSITELMQTAEENDFNIITLVLTGNNYFTI